MIKSFSKSAKGKKVQEDTKHQTGTHQSVHKDPSTVATKQFSTPMDFERSSILFRRAKESDLESIYLLAKHTGVGMTTLPADREFLAKRLVQASQSFQKKVTAPHNEYYLFVLEDVAKSQIVGTSAIEACTGHDLPFYCFKVSQHTQICESLGIRNDYEVLTLSFDNQGKSELCTLFLEPTYRKNGNGLLLSRARFLFMAEHPERFAETVIAEMRGVIDESGDSPFWNHVGEHFFHMPFAKADRLTMTTDKQFIADLLPQSPIHINLLPSDAQNVIGKPNQATIPAMNILSDEGFHYKNYVDIFDAGPTIEAARNQIQTIGLSQLITIDTIREELETPHANHYFLANTQSDFRAVIGPIIIDVSTKTGIINAQSAALLQVNSGDRLRVAPLHIPK